MMLIAGMLDCYMENPIFVILKLCTSLGVNHIIFYMFFNFVFFPSHFRADEKFYVRCFINQ